MSPPTTFSGQLPMMQVNHQLPQACHNRSLETKFRWNPVVLSAIPPNVAPPEPDEEAAVPTPEITKASPPPGYPKIRFAKARIPGYVTGDADPPARKKQRTNKKSEKLRLRSCKPQSSSADMHADAWTIILAHTRPAFIMQMRTVSKFFYHITNTDTVWRDAREYHYGAEMPPCPPFLTERQYAHLLDGRGCQNPRCERRETRKVRWVFRLRLCDDCLSKKLDLYKYDGAPSPQSLCTSLADDPNNREPYGASMIDLLPTSGTWSGKPNAPRCVTPEGGQWAVRSSSSFPLLYLKSDYVKAEAEFRRFQTEQWDEEKVVDWLRKKHEWATTVAKHASTLEDWELSRVTGWNTGTRPLRAKFFGRKASQLTPPMNMDILVCFAAYQNSIASPNPPTERAWELLLAKILPYRDDAEKIAQYFETRFTRFTTSSPESTLFDKLHAQRRTKRIDSGRWLPEQQFVLDLGEAEFNKLFDQVADEDLVLLCLRNVYDAYQKSSNKPQGLNFDGNVGVYRLSLDDAKLVVEQVMEKRIKKSTLRGVRIFEGLKCKGCTRFASGKRHSFQTAFEHMLDKHARLVGKDLHFHTFLKSFRIPHDVHSKDYRFPWYLIEWTKSLPVLPGHAEIHSETRWNPDEDVPYVQQKTLHCESAFEGRHPVSHVGIQPDNFIANFVEAAKTLSTTRLSAGCIVKIAIKYATGLDPSNHPTIDNFFACIKPTQQLANSLQFKFKCGACNSRSEMNSHLRCVKHGVDIEVLRKHWDEKHARESLNWIDDFMHLPSDTELMEIMLTQDGQLEKDQANSLEREIFGLRKNAKKQRDQKVGALMRKEKAISAFGRLFVPESLLSMNE